MTVQDKQDLDIHISHMRVLKGWLCDSLTQKAFKKSIDIAIESMKKQIPKKPIFVDTRFRSLGKYVSDGVSLDKCYKCPNCNSHIFHVWDSETYCPKCGQKIDWKEGGTSG